MTAAEIGRLYELARAAQAERPLGETFDAYQAFLRAANPAAIIALIERERALVKALRRQVLRTNGAEKWCSLCGGTRANGFAKWNLGERERHEADCLARDDTGAEI